MAYNLRVIHQLLDAAFSAGEILALAHYVFPVVYTDVTPGMKKSQIIQDILERAQSQRRISEL